MLTQYQVGGSLHNDDPTYVVRSSDHQLYNALKAGGFCYVFNSRQMGKSSLLVRTKHQLETEGYCCAVVDMTQIGSQDTTPLQWYKGIMIDLLRGFGCFGKLNFKTWWQEQEGISLVQKLNEFFKILLIEQFPKQNLCIFIDEIDSLLSLNFPIDDFFALIRSCYNQRAVNPEYERLTFALFGVATPSDLIADKTRTPFNIGTAINLTGFTLEEVASLAEGLIGVFEQPQVILQEVLNWTNGQPFLTQKLLNLLLNYHQKSDFIVQNSPTLWIKKIVRSQIIEKWESQDEPEHLRTIRDRLIHNSKNAGRLLGIYQTILQETEIEANDSREHIELFLSGLMIKHQGVLKVRNLIYQEVFNLGWVQQQLAQLRPYSQTFDAWIASGQQDESRLLRGQALKDAQHWALGKSLSDLDYQFLAASQDCDRQEVQLALEAERAKAIEAKLVEQKKRLIQEKKSSKRQRILLFLVSLALVLVGILSIAVYQQYQLAKISATHAKISEIQAIASSSKGLFASNKKFDALLEAIRAKQKLKQLETVDINTKNQVNSALRRAVYGVEEYNRLSRHKSGILDVNFSPNGQLIASASSDGTIKLWHLDGSLWKNIQADQAIVWSVRFSPDSSMLASGSDDTILKLWNRDGILLKTFQGHQAAIMDVAFSPDGQNIASASLDGTVKLWTLDGTLLNTFSAHGEGVLAVTFSPDGEMIVSGSADNTIKLWNLDGTLLNTFRGHSASVMTVAFSPDGQRIVSGSADNTIKLWNLDGILLNTLHGHDATVWTVKFSPDGKMIGSASWDKTLKIWDHNGSLLTTLKGNEATLWAMAFSPNSLVIASGSGDSIVKLWKINSPFLRTLSKHTASVWGVAFSPDHSVIASASWDKTVNLWNREGILLKTLSGHQSAVLRVVFSPDGQTIATGSSDGTIKLWSRDGVLLKTLTGHRAMVFGLAFSPDGEIIVSGSLDKTIKFWTANGTLLKTLKSGNSGFWSVAISPDSQMIVAGTGEGTVKIWNRQGSLLKIIKSHPVGIWILALSPDGQILATGSADQTVKLWKLDGTLLTTLRDHHAAVWGIAFSPTGVNLPLAMGQTIATSSVDNTIKIWKLDGTLLVTLEGDASAIRSIAFSRDGKTLASASDDNSVILWNMERVLNVDLLQYGCDWVKDYLRTNIDVKESDRSLCP